MRNRKQIKTAAFAAALFISLSIAVTGCSTENLKNLDPVGEQGTVKQDANKEAKKESYLTAPLLTGEGKRVTNFFGIHTMMYPEDNIAQHLDWAKYLVGEGGYIKERFEPISINTKGPSSHWVNMLKEMYKRNLIPIIRIGSAFDGEKYAIPQATAPGDYSELAAAVKRVFEQIPLKKGVPIYVEVYNEPNLLLEWGGQTPDPEAYGHLLVDISKALKSIGDPRIRVMNGALSPGGNYNNVLFVEEMIKTVPESLYAFDVWATHPYPANHPPEYNNHDKTAKYRDFTIDSYILELEILEKYGRKDTKVILTETGYELDNNMYAFEGVQPITEESRTDFSMRAFRDYWSKWPEIIAVCPFELSAVQNKVWNRFDWVQFYSESDETGYPTEYTPQYKAVADLPKPAYVPDPSLVDTEDKNMEGKKNSGNHAIGATVTSSSSIENWGWTLSKINNEFTADADLGWSSDGEQQDEWVVYEFPEAKEFSKLVLVPRSDGSETGKYFPQAFQVQVSDDGSTWKMVFTFKHPGPELLNPGAEPQEYTFDKTKGKYMRLYITQKANSDGQGYHAQLSEMEVY